MLKPYYIPPSLLVEGLFCNRRLWLKANHVEIFEEVQTLQSAKSLKNHIRGLTIDDSGWMFEARLPSGSRLDAWIPEEALGIEFKSGPPHPTHLYQVWALRQELSELGVMDAELQLWYLPSFAKEAEQLADSFGLDHAPYDNEVYAICADSEDPDFTIKLERAVSVLLGELESTKIPQAKEPASPTCRNCAYNPFCFC